MDISWKVAAHPVVWFDYEMDPQRFVRYCDSVRTGLVPEGEPAPWRLVRAFLDVRSSSSTVSERATSMAVRVYRSAFGSDRFDENWSEFGVLSPAHQVQLLRETATATGSFVDVVRFRKKLVELSFLETKSFPISLEEEEESMSFLEGVVARHEDRDRRCVLACMCAKIHIIRGRYARAEKLLDEIQHSDGGNETSSSSEAFRLRSVLTEVTSLSEHGVRPKEWSSFFPPHLDLESSTKLEDTAVHPYSPPIVNERFVDLEAARGFLDDMDWESLSRWARNRNGDGELIVAISECLISPSQSLERVGLAARSHEESCPLSSKTEWMWGELLESVSNECYDMCSFCYIVLTTKSANSLRILAELFREYFSSFRFSPPMSSSASREPFSDPSLFRSICRPIFRSLFRLASDDFKWSFVLAETLPPSLDQARVIVRGVAEATGWMNGSSFSICDEIFWKWLGDALAVSSDYRFRTGAGLSYVFAAADVPMGSETVFGDAVSLLRSGYVEYVRLCPDISVLEMCAYNAPSSSTMWSVIVEAMRDPLLNENNAKEIRRRVLISRQQKFLTLLADDLLL